MVRMIALDLDNTLLTREGTLSARTLAALREAMARGVLVVLATSAVHQAMPALMAFSAGAMMYVVICEMIPEAARCRMGTRFAVIGYVVMMALDIALG